MRTIITITVFFLTQLTVFSQQQADLTNFVKAKDKGLSQKAEIDSLIKLLADKFIVIANDHNSKTHKTIQNNFRDYKINDDNKENNYYPEFLTPQHLTIQFIKYSNNYGLTGERRDTLFTNSVLTALVLIPAFDNIHKGQVIENISFKVSFKVSHSTDANKKTTIKNVAEIIDIHEVEIK
jgi:hypothetical protein